MNSREALVQVESSFVVMSQVMIEAKSSVACVERVPYSLSFSKTVWAS